MSMHHYNFILKVLFSIHQSFALLLLPSLWGKKLRPFFGLFTPNVYCGLGTGNPMDIRESRVFGSSKEMCTWCCDSEEEATNSPYASSGTTGLIPLANTESDDGSLDDAGLDSPLLFDIKQKEWMVPSLGVKHPNEMEKKVFRGNLRKRCGMTCSERQSYNKYEKYVAPEKVNLKDFFDCPVGNESLFYQHLTVYPVSFNGHLQQEHYQYERLRYISFNSNVSYDFWESQAAAGGYFQDSLTSRVLCFACGRQYGFPHTVNCPRSVESIPFQFFPELPQTSNDIIDLGELNVTLTPTSNEDIVRPFNVRLRQGRRRATAPGPPLSQPSVPGRSAEPLPRRSPRPTPGEDVESAGPRPCPCEKSARIQFPAYMDLDDRIDSFRHHGRLSPFARRLAELGYYAGGCLFSPLCIRLYSPYLSLRSLSSTLNATLLEIFPVDI